MQTTPSGLQYDDTVPGSGKRAAAGTPVSVHYTGWLYENGVKGAKFDSSKDRNDPFEFDLGAGHVIKGWDEGVQGMQEGGTRVLVIPPGLGYGARGAGLPRRRPAPHGPRRALVDARHSSFPPVGCRPPSMRRRAGRGEKTPHPSSP